MPKHLLFWIAATTAIAPVRPRQTVSITVEPSRLVAALADTALVEGHLSIDPGNPAHMVIASMTGISGTGRDGSYGDCVGFATKDAGARWKRFSIPNGGALGCADAWTAILPTGIAMTTTLGDSGVWVRRSSDGGTTWPDAGTLLRGSHDHEIIVAGTRGDVALIVSGLSIRNEKGQARSSIFAGLTTDGGATIRERGRAVFMNTNYEAQGPVLFSDGELAVGFIDHSRDAAGKRFALRQWVATSPDSGATFGAPMIVTESCGPGWSTFGVAPVGAAGSDNLYFACPAADNTGIVFMTSSTRGNSWTAPLRIATERRDSTGAKAVTMAVSSAGTIAVTWYEKTGDPSRSCQHLYVAVSRDAGKTFGKARVSEIPSCPADGNPKGIADRFPEGGDYSGLVATGPDDFFAVWSSSQNGPYHLRSARIHVSG